MAKVHIVFGWDYDDGSYVAGVFAKKSKAKKFVVEENARIATEEAKKPHPIQPLPLRIESHKVE